MELITLLLHNSTYITSLPTSAKPGVHSNIHWIPWYGFSWQRDGVTVSFDVGTIFEHVSR